MLWQVGFRVIDIDQHRGAPPVLSRDDPSALAVSVELRLHRSHPATSWHRR
jgi:hypothetical protein